MISRSWFLASCFTLILVGGCQTQSQNKTSSNLTFAHVPIDTRAGGKIFASKDDAKKWTKKHRDDFGRGNANENKYGRAHYFSNTFLKTIMEQQECEGLNFYVSRDNGEARLIVVGVNKAGKDLTGTYNDVDPSGVKTTEVRDYLIGYSEMKCPNNCDDTSVLLAD
ncbi:hypothetical protein [Hymenobacter sp. YC55]|uniref:hypothetical protein n=1 Tax=Hymenobacter sp. YC55 TaxID=3034019 RepID=UPI0023F90C6C|nr:hypothetical protein [Hymenobacter sp. YC55]MDF7812471.1 hypothetical protein [Hymenobacter sp. YC55]